MSNSEIACAKLADEYLVAKLAGNTLRCETLEGTIRDLARKYSHRDDVLECLASMERHKSMRKPGAGAPKMLQEIAAAIESKYASGDFTRRGDCDGDKLVFQIDSLRVTCKDLPGAVALVVAKYRRGLGKSRGARYGTINA